MAWQIKHYRLTGEGPILFHNGELANPLNKFAKALKSISGKRKKTDADYEEMARLEFFAGLYMGQDGPVIPASNIDATIINAAKKNREGQLAKSGFLTLADANLEYDGPRTAEELWQDTRFRHVAMVRVQSSRIARTRPIFHDWAATVKVQFEDSLVNETTVNSWMEIAGSIIGLCDWRPKYGRFTTQQIAQLQAKAAQEAA